MQPIDDSVYYGISGNSYLGSQEGQREVCDADLKGYFTFGYPRKVFRDLNHYTQCRLGKHLNRIWLE